MGKIDDAVRSEIHRLARKEIRAVCGPLTKQMREMKREVRKLSKAVAALSKGSAAEETKAELPELKADPAEVEKARLSPGLIKKLRKRLAISQAELAKLIHVSVTTVSFWEQGRNRPTEESKVAIVALRKLGRRDVNRMLEARG